MRTPSWEKLSPLMMHSFASNSFFGFCFNVVMKTCIFMLVMNTCTATTWYSNIASRDSVSIPTAAVKYRNETASSGLFKMLQRFCFDPLKSSMSDRTASDTSQSSTGTVSVSSSHPNTREPKPSSSRCTIATYSLIRTLSWVSIIQSVDRLLKANDFDIAAQLLAKVMSQESINAVKIIRSILSDVHTEHGVVDVFGKYNTYDVLASILALSRLQSVVVAKERSLRKDWIQIAPYDSSRDRSDVNADLLQDLSHYSVYALAAYGWPMDFALQRRLHWGGNCQALARITGIDQKDIVKAEWNARAPHRPAYFIVRDHSRQSIVLCVRGTWSAHDLLTDLRCTSQYFDVEGYVGNFGCGNSPNLWNIFYVADRFLLRLFDRKRRGHHGMLEAARAVLSDTETIIERELSDYPSYSIVCVGHSLGGGCAALIGTLLERRHSDLRVFVFGAPCVVPENSRIHPNIVSVVLDGDPFSCLSLGHIADVSKALSRLCEDPLLRSEILLRTNSVGTKMSESDINWCCNTLNMLRRLMTAEKLFPPGRILLLKPGKKLSKRRHRRWWRRVKQSANKDVESSKLYQVSSQNFRDLVIGAKMIDLSRHLPSLYVSTLKEISTLPKGS